VAATGKRLGAGAAAEIAELAAERDDAEGADRRIEVIIGVNDINVYYALSISSERCCEACPAKETCR
jgi:hypothetical protein